MALNVGANAIGKLYLGSTQINKAYLGANVLFSSGFNPASLPSTRLFDGLYQRPELLFSSLAPLTPLGDNGVDKVALAIDTSQGVNVIADGTARTFTGLGAELATNYTLSSSATISNGVITVDSSSDEDFATAPLVGLEGKSALVEIEVGHTSGEFKLFIGGGEVLSVTGSQNIKRHAFFGPSTPMRVRSEGGFVGTIKLSVKEIPGIHGIQTIGDDQPSYDCDNFTLDLPGGTRTLTYPNAALGDDVTAMLLVKIPASDERGMLLGDENVSWGLAYSSNSTSQAINNNAGGPTYRINGVAITFANQGAAYTAIATDTWVIVTMHGATLTESDWRDLKLTGIGVDSRWEVEGLIKASVLMQAPSLADRNQAGNYLASLITGLEYTDET